MHDRARVNIQSGANFGRLLSHLRPRRWKKPVKNELWVHGFSHWAARLRCCFMASWVFYIRNTEKK